MWPGVENENVGIGVYDAGQSLQQDLDALLCRQPGRYADDRPVAHGVLFSERPHGRVRDRVKRDGWWNDDQLAVNVLGQIGRVYGVIAGIRRDDVSQAAGYPVLELHYAIHSLVEQAHRQLQIAMVGKHDRLAQQTAAQRQPRGVELRQVQVKHIGATRKLPGHRPKIGHEHTLADAQRHRNAHYLHPIHDVVTRQRWIIL